MREQNPKLAKQSRVLKVTMDAVYDFAITGSPGTVQEGVTFRFMPDAREVASALQVRTCWGYPFGRLPLGMLYVVHSLDLVTGAWRTMVPLKGQGRQGPASACEFTDLTT